MTDSQDLGAEARGDRAAGVPNVGRREFLKTAPAVGAGVGFSPSDGELT